MCLISIKPSGTPLSDWFLKALEAGTESNRHGHGYMLHREGATAFNFDKGMWSTRELIDKIKALKLKEGDVLAVHSRFSTHGKTNDKNCHPFVVLPTDKLEKSWAGMLKTSGTTENPLLMHNGIFSGFGYSKNFSDTFNFVRDFIAQYEVLKYKQSIEFLKRKIGGNKLAILHPKHGLLKIGHFIEDEGCFFSNAGYKSWDYGTRNTGGTGLNLEAEEALQERFGGRYCGL